MVKLSELKRFDVTEYLDSDQAIADYLTAVLEQNDALLLAATVGDLAKAIGMTQVAKAAGLSRESLYKSLGGRAVPKIDTLSNVLNSMGFKLVAEPIGDNRKNVDIEKKDFAVKKGYVVNDKYGIKKPRAVKKVDISEHACTA